MAKKLGLLHLLKSLFEKAPIAAKVRADLPVELSMLPGGLR